MKNNHLVMMEYGSINKINIITSAHYLSTVWYHSTSSSHLNPSPMYTLPFKWVLLIMNINKEKFPVLVLPLSSCLTLLFPMEQLPPEQGYRSYFGLVDTTFCFIDSNHVSYEQLMVWTVLKYSWPFERFCCSTYV